MDRSDRLLLEHQINDLDGMIRQMTNMRSVLVRRTQRMLNAPAASSSRAASSRPPATSGRIPSRARSSNVSRTDPSSGPVTVPVTVPVRVLKPKEKVVVIKKADLGKNMIDPCSICQEFYKKIDNVVSNCGHNCCKGCMTKWVEAQNVARKRATCPMCREQLTLLTGCRERAKPQRKPMAVNVIEDDVDSMVVEA